jgi:uncharacterized protein (UPF0548 family)
MRFVRPHDAGSVARLLATLPAAPLTYAEAGVTLSGSQPTGFHHHRDSIGLGSGRPAFERSVAGLQEWRAHHVPGIRVFRDTETIRPGTHVVVTLGLPVLALAAPCRVVAVVDEPDRWGFAYGTLPGHPEQGEEAFVVSIAGDDTVRFEITAFSRPGDALVRVSGPVGRVTQVAATKAYLGGLRRFVGASDHES